MKLAFYQDNQRMYFQDNLFTESNKHAISIVILVSFIISFTILSSSNPFIPFKLEIITQLHYHETLHALCQDNQSAVLR